MENDEEETAFSNVRRRMEDIKMLTLILEEQNLTKKQRNAVLLIRANAEDLINDIKSGYIDVEWGRNASS
jgi:hypothetical protein